MLFRSTNADNDVLNTTVGATPIPGAGQGGVRGLANEELTPGFALQVAAAAGSVVDADRVAVARDTRHTGGMFVDAVASGLASVGADVDRLGVLPTPGLQAYCERTGVPGVMVTASHNPPAYNGIKLVGADGVELSRSTLDSIEERLASGQFETVGWESIGQAEDVGPDEFDAVVGRRIV